MRQSKPAPPSILKRLSIAPPPERPSEPHHLCGHNTWRPTADGSGWRCEYCYPLVPPVPAPLSSLSSLSAKRQQFLLIGAMLGYPRLQADLHWAVCAGEEGWGKFAMYGGDWFFEQALAFAVATEFETRLANVATMQGTDRAAIEMLNEGIMRIATPVMCFSVSSWHFRPLAEWAALGAMTIMAVPPKDAPATVKNEPLFAAPKSLVFADDLAPGQYTCEFEAMLRNPKRLARIEQFIQDHLGQHVILLCACPGTSIEERFCHRYLVAKLLVELGCVEVALPERERHAAPVTISDQTKNPSPIYVDEIVNWGNEAATEYAARFFGNGKPSSHMSTPDHSPEGLERLHKMIEAIGGKRWWFQHEESRLPHYDLTPGMRAKAIKHGAIPVDCMTFVELCGEDLAA